ncbi:NAD-dependent protein deacylase-like [Cylas formicarius]|uniref:NAD-dependent protein deacylase-like n=1 Tax=Cylas formicarius TaxID=197179 RepID=UPI002958A0A0|nr:NAD-dependent protein deacylase-like [Cylas formicarius]
MEIAMKSVSLILHGKVEPFGSFFKMSKRRINDYAGFQKVLNESQKIVALTGAGVSAESGIPIFRGGDGALWRRYRALDLATPTAFRSNPGLVWEFYNYRRTVAFHAQPNKAHTALAKYERLCNQQGREFHIVTQNVDGLHQRAGSENIVELHGVLNKVICTKCKHIAENLDDHICEALRGREDPSNNTSLPNIEIDDLPKCKQCGSLVRPYIIWFGEHLDPHILKTAKNLFESCDLCLVIGTSSVVYPAAAFAPLVAERGRPVAEFNLNEEPAKDDFQFHFPGLCGTTLPRALGTDNI